MNRNTLLVQLPAVLRGQTFGASVFDNTLRPGAAYADLGRLTIR